MPITDDEAAADATAASLPNQQPVQPAGRGVAVYLE